MQDSNYILNELNELNAEVLVTAGNKNCFFVPGDYFGSLAGNVMAHVFIQSLPGSNPYSVPADYFENLPDIVLDKISISNNAALFNINEKNLYNVPEGYFNGLAGNVLKKIKTQNDNSVQQELEEIAPLLSKIPKTNVYAVPENYFDELKPLTVTANKKEAKVISFGSRKRNWFSYAAAACVTGVLFIGGYFYINNPGTLPTPPITKVDVQKEISGLTDAQITDYLDNNSDMAVYTSADDDQQNMDIQNLLQNVSDEEIQQYLNQDTEPAQDGEGI